VAVLAAVVLTLGWQFITDSSRAVPALDTAWYQWRAEYLQANEPADLIEIKGADGALAGGYRVAEPVLAGLMRTVGGVGAGTPTVVLSIMFRVLAALGLAAFAWRHRRSWLLFYLTLLATPALFLLQRFFGFLDNFFGLALAAGLLLLLEPVRTSWVARGAAFLLMLILGLSHPTTLALLLLSVGLVAVYRLIRERSVLAPLRAEGPFLISGVVAAMAMAAVWIGGAWGPTSSLGEAAVPPPETVSYFVDRSLSVFRSMQPWVVAPLLLLGVIALAVAAWKRREYFAEVTLAWTVPLAGMFGFLIGAAYPYFRFFNATLAPILVIAVGLALIVWSARRVRGPRPLVLAAPVVAVALVVGILFSWWQAGLKDWNSKPTWLTAEVRGTMAAASAFMRAEGDRTMIFAVDAQPGEVVPYGKYKEFANAIYAGLDGDQIDDAFVVFGRLESIGQGRPTQIGDPVYDRLAADSFSDARSALSADSGVLLARVFNEFSPNSAVFADPCLLCVSLSDGGLMYFLPSGGPDPDPGSVKAAREAAADARAFVADPPGPFAGPGGSLLALLRLGLLFGLPGFLMWRRLPDRKWPEALALVPLLSIGAVTTAGILVLAVIRQPFSHGLGWASIAVGTALAFGVSRLPQRTRPVAIARDSIDLFRRRDFTFLMGAQWLAQAADGLVGVALAKHIVFGGQAGFSLEEARSPEDILRIAILTFLPYAVLSPFFGVLVDRFDRRRLLIGANGIRALALAAVAILGIERLTDSPVGDGVLFGSFLLVLAGTRLLLQIKGAGLPAVLGERDLMHGNSISQAGSAIFQLAGAGTALVAASFLSSEPIILVGVLGYAVGATSAWAIGRLGYGDRTTPLGEEIRRILRNLAEGLREIGRRPRARLALASFLGIRTLLSFVLISIALASREFLVEKSDASTAIPAVAGALGAAVGFITAHALKERVPPARIVGGALLFAGAGVVAFGGIITLIGLSLVGFVVGLGFFLGKVGADTLMQEALSDDFRGRGFGLQDLVYNLSWILPALVVWAAWSDERARALLVGGGVLFLVWGAAITLWGRSVPAAEPPPTGARGPKRAR
jgi:hypothetical protein